MKKYNESISSQESLTKIMTDAFKRLEGVNYKIYHMRLSNATSQINDNFLNIFDSDLVNFYRNTFLLDLRKKSGLKTDMFKRHLPAAFAFTSCHTFAGNDFEEVNANNCEAFQLENIMQHNIAIAVHKNQGAAFEELLGTNNFDIYGRKKYARSSYVIPVEAEMAASLVLKDHTPENPILFTDFGDDETYQKLHKHQNFRTTLNAGPINWFFKDNRVFLVPRKIEINN